MDHHRQHQAQRVYDDVPLAAVDLLARVVSTRPPFSVVLTDWLSKIAAVGWRCGLRRRGVAPQLVVEPFQRAVLLPNQKYQYTILHGGKSWGNARHWQPVRDREQAVDDLSRAYFAGRPPGLGAGMKRETWAHWASVRSV